MFNLVLDEQKEDDNVEKFGDISKQQLPVIVTSPEVVVKTGSFYFLFHDIGKPYVKKKINEKVRYWDVNA